MLGSSAARADVVLDEARFVQRMNADRAAAGVPPLLVVPRLIEIARAWSRVLSDRSTSQTECTLSHNQNLLEVLRPASKVAENVGCGDGTADALHDAFMNSPHHRANILDPSFDSVGVGVFMNGETMFVSVEFIRTVVVPAPMVTLSPLPPLIPVPATVPSEKLASPAASRATAGNSKTASAPRASAPKLPPQRFLSQRFLPQRFLPRRLCSKGSPMSHLVRCRICRICRICGSRWRSAARFWPCAGDSRLFSLDSWVELLNPQKICSLLVPSDGTVLRYGLC
jgi:Cysteine-rich secretory protein family